jgi:uracil-DNA glycosylase
METLLTTIRQCSVCAQHLPNPPKPVIQAAPSSRIAIIGQAPGQKVQNSGIPWDDQSGKELRRWLNVTEEQFYKPSLFALVPMGFCYPGRGKSGDLPPRPECAPLWHQKLLEQMPNIQLTLLFGHYAQQRYLGARYQATLTDNVRNFRLFLPAYLPLVHPSPRNKIWQKRNPWFEKEVIPELQGIVQAALHQP